MLGDKYGRQKILAITIVIMSISTFCIGLIPSYATIGIWAPILLLLCKMAQGFSVGGEYTGASIFVAEYSPDRKRGFMGSWLDFGSIAGFVMGAGVVVLISSVVGKRTSSTGAGVSVLPGAAVRDYRSLSASCAGRDAGVPAAR
jgi:MHS family proline/betaine transporter-like MFS transporter